MSPYIPIGFYTVTKCVKDNICGLTPCRLRFLGSERHKSIKLGVETLCQPCLPSVRRHRLPFDIAVLFFFVEVAVLFFLAPKFIYVCIVYSGLGIRLAVLFDKKVNADADLNTKDVERRA